MHSGALLLIVLAASPVFALAVHALATRVLRFSGYDIPAQILCAGSVLAGNVPLLIMVVFFMEHGEGLRYPAWTLLYSLIVYNSLGYSYFHLFNMSETARRIRILTEVYRRGVVRGDELDSLYDTSDMIDLRIERLLASGQIRDNRGRYVIQGRLLYIAARVLSIWALVLGMRLLEDE